MEKKHWELIARHLSGDISREDEKRLFDWVNSHPENRKRFSHAQNIWTSIEKGEEKEPDLDKSWEILKGRLLSETPEAKVVPLYLSKPVLWLAAASIAAIFITVFIWNPAPVSYQATVEKDPFEAYKELVTADHLEIFYLADSSRVWLNKNSRLKYPETFEKERIVHLEGEAFFEIKRDSLHPFMVYTEHSLTRILGTSFNLKAYPKEEDIQLTVATGEVEFSSKEANGDKVILQKDEKATLSKKGKDILTTQNAHPDYLSWKNDPNELKKTSLYRQEVSSPLSYLNSEYRWRDNIIKQTIIEGTINNSAIFTSYKNIKLRVYYSRDGKKKEHETFTVYKTIPPGTSLSYKFRLGNWLESTLEVKAEIIEAKAITE